MTRHPTNKARIAQALFVGWHYQTSATRQSPISGPLRFDFVLRKINQDIALDARNVAISEWFVLMGRIPMRQVVPVQDDTAVTSKEFRSNRELSVAFAVLDF